MFDKRLWAEARQAQALLAVTILLSGGAAAAAIVQAHWLSQLLSRVFLDGQGLAGVGRLMGMLLAAILIRAALAFGRELSANRIAIFIQRDLRQRLLAQLFALGPIHAQKERTGELTAAMTSGIDALESYFSEYLPQLFMAALIPVGILAAVFPIDWPSGLLLLVTLPLLPIFMTLIGRYAEALTQRQWGILSQMSAHFLDVLQGLTTLKILGQSRRQSKNIAAISDQFRQVTLGVLRVAFLSALVLELLSTLSVAVVAVAIGLRLMSGSMSLAPALFVLVLAPEFYLPLRQLGQRFHTGMAGMAAAARLFQLLDQPADQPLRETGESSAIDEPMVRLDGVHFAFDDGQRSALNGVSLTISRGETAALVGASGAGKSSVAQLLLGFIKPDRGTVRIAGAPEKGVPVGWVPQRPYLFHDTVAANIRLGKPKASDEQVKRAAQLARADAFIQGFPDGYQTVIGELGARLSGGQAARIAIARAYLLDAPLLIMDEATAHLDAATEHELMAATEALLAGRTALIIAHRLTTIRAADQILVMDQGRVTERGSHQELSAAGGLYAEMLAAGADSLAPLVSPPAEAGVLLPLLPASPPAQGQSDAVLETLTDGQIALQLLRLLRPAAGWAILAVLLGAATVGSGIGLLATAAYLISAAALQPSIAELSIAIVGVRFFGLSRGVLRYLERLVSHNVTFRLLARLRVWFYGRLEPLAPARLAMIRGGDLLSRIVADIETLADFYVRLLGPAATALLVAGGTALWVAVVYSTRLALTLLLLLLLGGGGLPLLIRRGSRASQIQMVELRAALHWQIIDAIQGMADIHAFGQSGRFLDGLANTGDALSRLKKKSALLSGVRSGLFELLVHGSMWLMLLLAIPQVEDGPVSGVLLASLALAVVAAFEAAAPLSAAAESLGQQLQAARRIFALAEGVPERKGGATPSFPPAVELRDVSFRYDPGDQPALRQINLSLPPGRRVALVGPSGSGKTTVLNLLLAFWSPQDGAISLNGRAYTDYRPDAVRGCFAVVSQHAHLFNGTIGENLRLARPDADWGEIRRAAELAQIDDFIESLPQGYQTQVGEFGARLSGGERQRLALAQALVKDAPIWLLDEPTGQLDAGLAEKLMSSLESVWGGKTVLLISHRLLGLEKMDEILFLEDGQVVERGQHESLVAAGGRYADFWQLQQMDLPSGTAGGSQ